MSDEKDEKAPDGNFTDRNLKNSTTIAATTCPTSVALSRGQEVFMEVIRDYNGTLRFTKQLRTEEIVSLNYFLEEYWPENPDWGELDNVGYIPFQFNDDCSGLWFAGHRVDHGVTVNLVEAVNALIYQMKKSHPDFGLKGSLVPHTAYGILNWELYIGEDGFAHVRDLQKIACPHCRSNLILAEVR